MPFSTTTGFITFPLMAVSLFAFAAINMGCITTAEAHPRNSSVSSVDFDDLYVTSRGNAVDIEYEINRRDWRRLQRSGQNPRMELYLPQQRRHSRSRSQNRNHSFYDSHTLRTRRGTVTFYGASLRSRDQTVQIGLATAERRRRGRTNYRNQRSHRQEVTVVHPRRSRDRTTPPRRSNRSRSSINIRLQF